MYKPSKEDIMFAKAVNDKLVATQTYEPNDMREAYRRLFGEEAPNQHFARSKVFTYFQYTYKAVDETETAIPVSQTLSTHTSTSSHEESQSQKNEDGDNQILMTNLKLLAKPKRTRIVETNLKLVAKPKRQRKTKKTDE